MYVIQSIRSLSPVVARGALWVQVSSSFCMSLRPPFRLYGSFLGIGPLVFMELSMVLGALAGFCITARFFGKNPLLGKKDQKLLKMTQQ